MNTPARKRKRRLFLKTAVFLALLVCAITVASRLVERKASIVRLKPFLDHPEDYDVLFIGDSHMVNDVFPMELWEDYGIAAYNISSYGNTLPVSYWAMMNALDYASPQLMVIGVKDVQMNYKVSGSSSDVHTALDAYPLSLTKIRAVEDLMSDPYALDDEGNRYADIRWEYYFTLGKYHTRWSELQPSDFRLLLNCQKGADVAVGVADPREYEVDDDLPAAEQEGWGFLYLRKMIEECLERGIEVLLVHLPYPATPEEQMAANAVGQIAEEYEVDYVDLVNLDNVVDYEVDLYDSFSHLNPSGAKKVTDFLGRYIVEHYGIADHRGEAQYARWQADEDAYAAFKLDLLCAQSTPDNLLMLLHDADYSLCLSIPAGSPVYQDDKLLTLLQNIARDHIFEEDAFSRWSNILFPLERLDEAAGQGARYDLIIDRAAGRITELVGEDAPPSCDTAFGTVAFPDAQDDALRIVQAGETARFCASASEAALSLVIVDADTGAAVLSRQFENLL